MTLIETDAESRTVLPGYPHQRFFAVENSDGSILLIPTQDIRDAQEEYDKSPELRDLLARAVNSKTVQGHRE